MSPELVVIGAHPMDAEILGGAVAATLGDRGASSILVHVTTGARTYPHLGSGRSAAQCHQEATRSARLLGCAMEWCGFDSRKLTSRGQFVDGLAARLKEWNPMIVITHWHGSWHERHRITHHLVVKALAAAGITPHLYFAENFEDLRGFTPTRYLDITGAADRWWQALSSYKLYGASKRIHHGDHETFPYDAYYRAMPRMRGLEVGLPLAQALSVGGQGGGRRMVVDSLGVAA